MSKRFTGLAALLALGLTFTGCQVSSPDDAPTRSEGTQQGANPTGNPASKAITIQGSEPGGLNPGRQLAAYDMMMIAYTALTMTDDKGAVSMAQAESVQSSDASNWTIKIKDGWTFHNGEPVTAQSYVDSWNACAYGPNAWENAGELANIVGFDEANTTTNPVKEMSGLKVVDNLTFTVQLKAPDGQFPAQLSQAQTAFFPIPKAGLADLESYNKQPIGDGPFMFTAPHNENADITMKAYDKYAGTTRPTLGQITWKMYTDPMTAYNDVLAGNLDIAGVPLQKMAVAEKDFGKRLYPNPAPGISYLGLPGWDKRYQDVRVRQAISMAINRDAINKAIYAGLFTPAKSFTPATEFGTPADACGEFCTYNPDRAKQLLAEAGGFAGDMVITFPGGAGLDDLYNAYANQIRQNLGINATAKATTDWAQFQSGRAKKEFDGPFFARWGALYPSQQNTLRAFFTKQGGGGCENCGGGSFNPEVEKLMAAADQQVDPAKAAAGYAAVQEVLKKELPAIPMFDEKYVFVTSERIASLTQSQGSILLEQVQVKD